MVARRRARGTARPVQLGRLLPDKAMVSIVYVDEKVYNTVSGAGGVGTEWGFRTNSIADPDYTGGGHQPRGRDQWAGLYQSYYVVKCHVSVKMALSDAALGGSGWAAIYQNNSSTPHIAVASSTNYDNLERLTDPDIGAKVKHFSSAGGGSTQWVFLSATYYPKRVLDRVNFQNRSALMAGSPANVAYAWFHTKFPGLASTSFRAETKLTYTVMLMDPVDITGS